MKLFKLFSTLFALTGIIYFSSCSEHRTEITSVADTLSAVAINPQTVISSIKEMAYAGDTNYKIIRSPVFSRDQYFFYSECFFRGKMLLPALVTETGDWGINGNRLASYLNEDDKLYYAGIYEQVMPEGFYEYSEYRAYYKDEKLDFAEGRKCNVEDTLNKMKFVLVNKNNSVIESLNYTPITHEAEKLMDAATLKGDFGLLFLELTDVNGKTFANFKTLHKKNWYETNLRVDNPQLIDKIKNQKDSMNQRVIVKFHNDDQNAVLDEITLAGKN